MRPFVASLVAALVCALALGACATLPESNERTFIPSEVPSYTQFKEGGVSGFLERRCGTLDCHGRPERPLRIFGSLGLRYASAAGVARKSDPTTEQELRANFAAVVGLEPELITRVVQERGAGECRAAGEANDPRAVSAGDACLRRLLLVAKPLACGLESRGCDGDGLGVEHKGGPVIAQDDDGYACLASWLRGAVDGDRCRSAAVLFDPPRAGDSLSAPTPQPVDAGSQ